MVYYRLGWDRWCSSSHKHYRSNSGIFAKLFADRSIEGRKADLGRELERLKSDLSKDAERLKSELAREGEIHKLHLKKREMLFGKEFDAVTAFMKLRRAIEPAYSYPDMDWHEARREVARNFSSHEASLGSYIVLHGAFIAKASRKLIEEAETTVSIHKFDGIEDEELISWQAIEKAGDVIETLRKVEESLIDDLRSWEL